MRAAPEPPLDFGGGGLLGGNQRPRGPGVADVALDLNVDPVTAEKIREIHALKEDAVNREVGVAGQAHDPNLESTQFHQSLIMKKKDKQCFSSSSFEPPPYLFF